MHVALKTTIQSNSQQNNIKTPPTWNNFISDLGIRLLNVEVDTQWHIMNTIQYVNKRVRNHSMEYIKTVGLSSDVKRKTEAQDLRNTKRNMSINRVINIYSMYKLLLSAENIQNR